MNEGGTIEADIEDIAKIASVPSLLDVVCRTTGMGFACVARVTEEKWVALSVQDNVAFGLRPGGELKLDTTICHELRQHRQAVVIDNVSEDPAYAKHHTPAMYGLQSYISVPIILKDGSFFGTLCAIDPKPAKLNNAHIRGLFDCFVDLIATHLNNIRGQIMAESALAEEKQTANLREGFIAILGHDLRNPITAIKTSAQLIDNLKEYNGGLIKVIEKSATRINDLVDTMLDLARGRLAGGIQATRTVQKDLRPVLQQVIDELQTIFPHKQVEVYFDNTQTVIVDHARIAQLFSNLLSNALKYGSDEQPVQVKVITTAEMFALSVSNAGKKIPAASQELLFKPFSRGTNHGNKPGLGLGLYIAAEIARAHNGVITVESSEAATTFIFRMPANPVA